MVVRSYKEFSSITCIELYMKTEEIKREKRKSLESTFFSELGLFSPSESKIRNPSLDDSFLNTF